MRISFAPDAWKLLSGIFCVYKPSGVGIKRVRQSIIVNLCRDLNLLEGRPPAKHVKIVDNPSSPTGLDVINKISLADHPLAVGPRYMEEDIKLSWTIHQGHHTSGLCVMGINCGSKPTRLREGRYLKMYHLSGQFGLATDDFHVDGKIVEKTTFGHLTKQGLDRVLTSLQAAHQRNMHMHSGVDIKSETAYELAHQGPIRPASNTSPIVYGIRCIDFSLPHFILEVHCINETEAYLMSLIHEIGLLFRSTAACTTIRQIRFGPYDLQLALLRKNWTLEHIINNITRCRQHVGRSADFGPDKAHFFPTPEPDTTGILNEGDATKRLPPVG